jgi:8-oxo-dGTP pyrophosphatase MutT (NUDIX family)
MAAMSLDLMRHLSACNNTPSAGHLLPLAIGAVRVGFVAPELAEPLRACGFEGNGGGLALPRTGAEDALAAAARVLLAQGRLRLRGEAFDVRAGLEGPVLARLDRGAIPAFGVIGHGVHVNGLVRRADGLHVWVGVRARDKAVAPGQLDNLVGGGIPAGLDARATLLKEAEEEASIPEALAREARPAGRVTYVLTLPEGLRRDVLHVFDLELPEDFVPRPNDDEVERFELWPAARLLAAVRETEQVKFNVNLVLIDLFLREGLIDPGGAEGRALRAALDPGVWA